MNSLSLGKVPLPGELPAEDDVPFKHFSLKHRIVAWISRRLFDRVTYTVRHGLLRGMRRRGGLGWLPAFLAHGSETKEESFWRGLDLTGAVVYDIGAYHGLLTMFFATRCRQVVSYEPNELNRARLIENVCLNSLINVQVRKFALGSDAGSGTLRYTPEMAGGGTLDPSASASASQAVEITTLDGDIAASALPAPDLIKIDIEGWELAALEGARQTLARYHPALFLELHGETMREKERKARDVVLFLVDAGYHDIVHVETGVAIQGDNAPAEGHLYCQYTASRSMECPTKTSQHAPKASSASSR
jgi:FkbM family methyltransferase